MHNITDESGGNALEQVVHGLEIRRPLPPDELFFVEQIKSSMGKTSFETRQLSFCPPTLLGDLEGFPIGHDTLNVALREKLKKLMQRMDQSHSYWLVGHTDDRGSSAYNKKLSMRRAAAVKDILVLSGFDPKHLNTDGRGKREPLERGRDEQNMQRNRRVEIYPAAHPRLLWHLSALKPDEKATLEITLKPRSWANNAQALIKGEACYKMNITHQKTLGTQAKLVINAHLRPEGPGFSKQWLPEATLSVCDRLHVQVGVTNQGGISAKGVQLVSRVPEEWWFEDVLSKVRILERRKHRQIVFTNTRLWPQQEWVEHYQVVPHLLKPSTDVHEVSAHAKEGFSAQTVKNKVHWHAPLLSIHTKVPKLSHAGKPILQQIRISNAGNWPIHQPTLIATLPPAINSIIATGAVIANNRVTWHLNTLQPGAEQNVQLSFSTKENKDIAQLETHFIAFDQAYGDEMNNHCVKAKATSATQVGALQPPQLKIVSKKNALPIGQKNQYHLELSNPNALPLAYSLEGKLNPKVWQLLTPQVKVSIEGDKSKEMNIDIKINETGKISIRDSFTLATNDRLSFTFTLQARSLSSQTLQAIANNLISSFDVAEIQFKAQMVDQTASSKAVASTVIYQ